MHTASPTDWWARELDWPEDPIHAARVVCGDEEMAWLDGPGSDPSVGAPGRSLICFDPFARIDQAVGRPARLRIGKRIVAEGASAWDLWRETLRSVPRLPRFEVGVSPGWVGYVGFEAAAFLLPHVPRRSEDQLLPIVRLSLFDRAVLLDHGTRRARLIMASGVRDALGITPGAELDAVRERWNPAAARSPAPRATGLRGALGSGPGPGTPRVVELLDGPAYERSVARALEYIAAGDIYQVNLSHAIRLAGLADPWTCYVRLRRINPAPYAALLSWPGEPPAAVVSASPELFLQLRGEAVLSSPIKGTRPRIGDEPLDRARRMELMESAKDAAELAMIVDLHRNDLGRVCLPGTVRVPAPRRLETHPRVFHTVADIIGRLAPGRDALDLLAACFPAGSISGVPKIRALQIIHELERGPRGVYTGAVGVLGLDGQMTMNVAIRTLYMRGSTGHLHVGGGVVADSDPAEEYEETLAKACGILEALGADVAAAGAAFSARTSTSTP